MFTSSWYVRFFEWALIYTLLNSGLVVLPDKLPQPFNMRIIQRLQHMEPNIFTPPGEFVGLTCGPSMNKSSSVL